MQLTKNYKKQFLYTLLFIGLSVQNAYAENKHFAIIIPSWNNSEWCERNLSVLINQDYDNWHAIYINDASYDDTGARVAALIKQYNVEDKIMLINNETRQGALANIYRAVYMCDDGDIAVTYDGDDWLSNTHVLSFLNDIYADENIWLTYGSYQDYYPGVQIGDGASPTPLQVVASNGYRKDDWRASHLRTFYVWLFKSIKTEDLMIDDIFFPSTYDQAIMFPMLEMAAGRFKYIKDILYVYNMVTPHNDYKVKRDLQKEMERIIRSRTPYDPLKEIILSKDLKPARSYETARDTPLVKKRKPIKRFRKK